MIAVRPERVQVLARELESASAKQTPAMTELVVTIVKEIGQAGGEIILHPAAEPFLTTAEVAQMFRVTSRVVRKWCESGRLQATRVGLQGEWRILRSQFSAGPAEIQGFVETVKQINSRFGGEEIDDYE